MLCRYHKYRQRAVRLSDYPRKLIAVHFRHHHIENDKVDMLAIKQLESLFAVLGGRNGIILALEHSAQQHSRMLIVVRYEYMKHVCPPCQ